MSKVWYKWPANYYETNWKPWYRIIWGLVTVPLLCVSFSLFYLCMIISVGFEEAESIRKDIF